MHFQRRLTRIITILILPVSIWAPSSAADVTPSDTGEVPSYRIYSDEAYETILQFHDYDPGIPLSPRTVGRMEAPDYIQEKIVFNGVRDSRVPGYIGIPKTATEPSPCVILIHGMASTKENWWRDDS